MDRQPAYTISAALFSVVVSACSPPDIELIDPWIPTAPPNVTVFAGYFELRNNTSASVVLNAVNSPRFDTVEIHRTMEENGVVKMIREEAVTVPPNAIHKFAPGGFHLMMIDPGAPLEEGISIPVELYIEGRDTITVDFAVRRMDFDL